MSTHSAPSEDRRAAADHPSLQRTLRGALELVSRELPEFDTGLRRLLVARYRDEEGIAASTPGSRAKALALAHEAAFRSALPRMVAISLNAEFQRLGGRGPSTPRPDADGSARAGAIAALARRVPIDGPDGVAELDRRLARQLGLETLDPAANPLRPAVFLHAVGLCWRAVAGSERHELDVIGAYGVLWLPVLRRLLLPALVAGLPAAPPRIDAPAPSMPGPAALAAPPADPLEPARTAPTAAPALAAPAIAADRAAPAIPTAPATRPMPAEPAARAADPTAPSPDTAPTHAARVALAAQAAHAARRARAAQPAPEATAPTPDAARAEASRAPVSTPVSTPV